VLQIQAKISKEELNELPQGSFVGKIIVIENILDLQKVIPFLRHQKELGFDTETRPAFKKGRVNMVALLQISTAKEAFLFRISKMGLPAVLADILADESIIKVGAAIRDDIKALQKITPFIPGGFVELQNFVKQFGIEDAGLQKLSGNILGFKISKGQRLSNWENAELTEAQQIYAATDAWVGLEIFTRLKINGFKNETGV
jgi:ribonuclease D